MNEYIEKNALYKKIAELEELARNRYLDTPSNSPACARYMAQLDERTRFKHMIYDSPAADVAEVKHGKWIKHSVIKCSVCGSCTDIQSDEAYEKFIESYYYCLVCGSKLDLED